MNILPIFYKASQQQSIIIIGGGEDASRKIRILLRTESNIILYADNLNAELKKYKEDNKIIHKAGMPNDFEIKNATLVFGASDDDNINELISKQARGYNTPVNVVDKPELSDFIMGGIVDRSPLVISICSNGYAPILVRNIRILIETLLDKNLGKLATFAQKFRSAVQLKYSNGKHRKRFWEEFFNGEIATLFLQGKKQQSWKKTMYLLNRSTTSLDLNTQNKNNTAQEYFKANHNENNDELSNNKYYEINLLNNSSDDLTLRDIRHLQLADVIVCDEKTNNDIYEYFRRDAIRHITEYNPDSKLYTDNKICIIKSTNNFNTIKLEK